MVKWDFSMHGLFPVSFSVLFFFFFVFLIHHWRHVFAKMRHRWTVIRDAFWKNVSPTRIVGDAFWQNVSPMMVIGDVFLQNASPMITNRRWRKFSDANFFRHQLDFFCVTNEEFWHSGWIHRPTVLPFPYGPWLRMIPGVETSTLSKRFSIFGG